MFCCSCMAMGVYTRGTLAAIAACLPWFLPLVLPGTPAPEGLEPPPLLRVDRGSHARLLLDTRPIRLPPPLLPRVPDTTRVVVGAHGLAAGDSHALSLPVPAGAAGMPAGAACSGSGAGAGAATGAAGSSVLGTSRQLLDLRMLLLLTRGLVLGPDTSHRAEELRGSAATTGLTSAPPLDSRRPCWPQVLLMRWSPLCCQPWLLCLPPNSGCGGFLPAGTPPALWLLYPPAAWPYWAPG
jgi:hypothetical protein